MLAVAEAEAPTTHLKVWHLAGGRVSECVARAREEEEEEEEERR